ncbi:hypothetical protein [Kutzneria sp. 744]|uniref:hypothetical protein n=1 Tax=Kutzneria sp. (strain 744) TaxID=345341 RepID=UPI0003EED517|nr:hypothetical protein [Kutzneria sp. 744]EWM19705.1 hypothetical protein KUTG_10009 [Kutzneria sp. 744]
MFATLWHAVRSIGDHHTIAAVRTVERALVDALDALMIHPFSSGGSHRETSSVDARPQVRPDVDPPTRRPPHGRQWP